MIKFCSNTRQISTHFGTLRSKPLQSHELRPQVNAEIIVTFEGTTEFGNPFMARQSYLPTEIHWGHKFVGIMGPPAPGQTRYMVDITKWVFSQLRLCLELGLWD
jgi:hypothetical protein